jgi:hypothetical protein
MSKLSAGLRFESKSIPEPNSGCFLWLGTLLGNGYGQFKAEGVRYLAHRYAWERENGPVPDGLEVRHFVCANRTCVNVRHMRLGTAKDNADDRARDGRTAKGVLVNGAQLTEDIVRLVREEYGAKRATLQALADKYGVTKQAIWFAATRKTWRHV